MLSSDRALVARNRLASAITVLAGTSLGCALGGMTVSQNSVLITSYFFAVQDAPVLLLFAALFAALGLLFKTDLAIPVPGVALIAIKPHQALRLVTIAFVVGCCLIWAGSHLVYQNYGLSVDEFMAEFDSRIIASGRLIASVAPEWRPYVPALQPIFRLELPENAYWISSYLPMNAAIRAAFVWLGAPAWEGVVLAGVAIVAVYAAARRLWPGRPDAAVVGVALLVCSSQFLITAMTPYAMTAHLALNMVWLALFLRDTRAGHLMAGGVAFVACGLHQVVFHPLFAAPFIVSLVMARRWKLAAYYVAVYGVIGLFWVLYWSMLVRTANASMTQAADVGMLNFIQRIAAMIDFSPGGIFFMGSNLLRFLAWQSPLVIPLAFVGLFAGRERSGAVINLAAGMALTLCAVLVLMPFQGHGWGYRYLHGFLGGLALIAAQGWIYLTERGAETSRTPICAVALNGLLSLVVLLPWHAYQVHAFIKPYAAAVATIEHSGADVVIVDPTDIWYGEDLVRNDPFLHRPPKMLSLPRLDEAGITKLCRRYDVAIFDRTDAQRLGMRIVQSPPQLADQDRRLRTLARSLSCGRPVGGLT